MWPLASSSNFCATGVISPYWSGLREIVVTTRITLDPREVAWYDWLAESELEVPAPRRSSCRARWGVLLYEDEVLRGSATPMWRTRPRSWLPGVFVCRCTSGRGPDSSAYRPLPERIGSTRKSSSGTKMGPMMVRVSVRQAGRRPPANGGKIMEQNRRNGVSRRGLIRGGLLAVAASGVAVVGLAGPASAAAINLGLDKQGAQRIQRWTLTMYGYKGKIDGVLGTNSWKAMQRFLANWPDQPLPYKGDIDGIVGPKTIASLQANLKKFNGYTGAIDGIAGPGTKAAFRRKAYSNPPV